jgi:hypothetical protein
MLYKQGIMREEKVRFALMTGHATILYALMFSIPFWDETFVLRYALVEWLLFLPLFLAMVLGALANLEWYHFYHDRVEVRNVYGIRSVAYYADVTFIEKRNISLSTHSKGQPFYVFHEDKKEIRLPFSEILDYDSDRCHNRRRINVRVYYTEELERFIQNTLKEIKVVVRKNT